MDEADDWTAGGGFGGHSLFGELEVTVLRTEDAVLLWDVFHLALLWLELNLG
jgi:hypothetical protein